MTSLVITFITFYSKKKKNCSICSQRFSPILTVSNSSYCDVSLRKQSLSRKPLSTLGEWRSIASQTLHCESIFFVGRDFHFSRFAFNFVFHLCFLLQCSSVDNSSRLEKVLSHWKMLLHGKALLQCVVKCDPSQRYKKHLYVRCAVRQMLNC